MSFLFFFFFPFSFFFFPELWEKKEGPNEFPSIYLTSCNALTFELVLLYFFSPFLFLLSFGQNSKLEKKNRTTHKVMRLSSSCVCERGSCWQDIGGIVGFPYYTNVGRECQETCS